MIDFLLVLCSSRFFPALHCIQTKGVETFSSFCVLVDGVRLNVERAIVLFTRTKLWSHKWIERQEVEKRFTANVCVDCSSCLMIPPGKLRPNDPRWPHMEY